jgi:hypothetical protein
MVMKGKFIAASAALAFALGLSVPALAADCDPSRDGVQAPGKFIAFFAKQNNGLSNSEAFPYALNGTPGFDAFGGYLMTDDKKGLGGDAQNALGMCGIGSRRNQPEIADMVP